MEIWNKSAHYLLLLLTPLLLQIPEDPEALDDEALQELQEELTADFDIGYSIKDSIIPRAVEW